MDRLKGATQAGARVILDNRLTLCEKCSWLATGTANLQPDQIQLAVQAVMRAGLPVPLDAQRDLARRVGLDLWQAIAAGPAKSAKDAPVQRLVEFLIPLKEHALPKHDIFRPTFSNLSEVFETMQAEEIGQCELADEIKMQEVHEEQWQAVWCFFLWFRSGRVDCRIHR